MNTKSNVSSNKPTLREMRGIIVDYIQLTKNVEDIINYCKENGNLRIDGHPYWKAAFRELAFYLPNLTKAELIGFTTVAHIGENGYSIYPSYKNAKHLYDTWREWFWAEYVGRDEALMGIADEKEYKNGHFEEKLVAYLTLGGYIVNCARTLGILKEIPVMQKPEITGC